MNEGSERLDVRVRKEKLYGSPVNNIETIQYDRDLSQNKPS